MWQNYTWLCNSITRCSSLYFCSFVKILYWQYSNKRKSHEEREQEKMNAKKKKSLYSYGILIYQDVSWEKFNGYLKTLNLLTPRRIWVSPLTEISILFQEGIIKKISYERRDYESVDEKSVSYAISRKTTKKI